MCRKGAVSTPFSALEATVAARRTLQEWAALGGVLYVVLFVIGNLLMFAGASAGDDPPAKIKAFFADSGHRDRISLGWIVAGLGLFFFLWFVGALREAVRRTEGDGLLTTLTGAGGVVYATLAFGAIALNSAVRTMSDDTYRHQVYPELIHAADDAGYVMHATGGAGIALMVIAASIALTRSGFLPGWTLWVGLVVGLAALASIAFLPVILWLLWILAMAITLFARGGRVARTTQAPPGDIT